MLTAARFLALSFAVLSGACSFQGSGAEAVPATSTASGIVIAQIVTHDSKVAILGSSARGSDLRVVVRKIDGTMVADGITLAELRTVDPDIYMVVTSAFATEGTSFVDATLGTMN